jgi:hypothetical protein
MIIIENPEVTLKEEYALGIPAVDGPIHSVSSWAIHTKVDGDDGQTYWIDTILCVGWGADARILSVRTGEGEVRQIPDSIYKVVDFPPPRLGLRPFPRGATAVAKRDDKVVVEMEGARVEADGKTWHYVVEDKDERIKVDWVHTATGFPTWYGKDKPQAFSPHQLAYGFFWPGHVEGVLTIDGREVRIKGKGARERVYMPDACPAESGGWHEWIWFHFDELFGTMDEMKISKFKDGALNLVDEQKYLQFHAFDIEHHDWAFHPDMGVFIPTRYRVTVETDEGVLEFGARIVGAAPWAVTGEVPDFPFALLHWDEVQGTFTYKDGRKRTLTNGRAANIARQWKPYPRMLSPEALGMAPKLLDKPIL